MIKSYFSYDHMYLWGDAPWVDHISYINGLAQWMGKELALNDTPYTGRTIADPMSDPAYMPKTKSWNDPEVVNYWSDKGILMSVLSQAGKYWVCMCPEKVCNDRMHKVPALCVFHQERIDPYWAVRTVEKYKHYNEMLADTQDFMIVYLVSEGPDLDRIYLNIMQEAFILFPADLTKVWLDVTLPLEKGVKLADIPEFFYFDEKTMQPADPDANIEHFGRLNIPYVNVGNRWGNRDSLTRGLIMNYARNEGTCDRHRLLHSQAGKDFMYGILLEWKYNTVYDEGLVKYWDDMGLVFGSHEKNGERWLSFVPKGAFEEDCEKLPCVLCLQEVYPGNEHLSVTCEGYFHELLKIAAQGECIVLCFVLEDPDSNDLFVDILAEAKTMFPIEDTRVYTIGHSHDGSFARVFTYRHPELIAALATLGNGMNLASSAETGNPVGGTDDGEAKRISKIQMPVINLVGELETEFPKIDSPAFRTWVKQYQRRLVACDCPMKSYEELRDIQINGTKAERSSHIPADKEEVLWLDGSEHYIIDIKNNSGKYWLRSVVHENMPHTTNPVMLKLAWSFLRRFSKDQTTGEIIELY